MIDYAIKKELVLADPNLGKVRDDELAEKYGVSKSFVSKIRNKCGIPFQWKQRKAILPAPQRDKVKKYSYLLGKYSDTSIAETLAVHRETVRSYRIELGIPAHPSGKKLTIIPLSDEEKLMNAWKCIPERVGLTKNQWLRRND